MQQLYLVKIDMGKGNDAEFTSVRASGEQEAMKIATKLTTGSPVSACPIKHKLNK